MAEGWHIAQSPSLDRQSPASTDHPPYPRTPTRLRTSGLLGSSSLRLFFSDLGGLADLLPLDGNKVQAHWPDLKGCAPLTTSLSYPEPLQALFPLPQMLFPHFLAWEFPTHPR